MQDLFSVVYLLPCPQASLSYLYFTLLPPPLSKWQICTIGVGDQHTSVGMRLKEGSLDSFSWLSKSDYCLGFLIQTCTGSGRQCSLQYIQHRLKRLAGEQFGVREYFSPYSQQPPQPLHGAIQICADSLSQIMLIQVCIQGPMWASTSALRALILNVFYSTFETLLVQCHLKYHWHN